MVRIYVFSAEEIANTKALSEKQAWCIRKQQEFGEVGAEGRDERTFGDEVREKA